MFHPKGVYSLVGSSFVSSVSGVGSVGLVCVGSSGVSGSVSSGVSGVSGSFCSLALPMSLPPASWIFLAAVSE